MRAGWERFEEVLRPVLTDVLADHPDHPVRVVRSSDPDLHAVLWVPDGSGVGLSVLLREDADARELAEAVADLAGTVQEAVIECVSMRGGSSTWPECPLHPGSHPLAIGVRGEVVTWDCPSAEVPIAPVGRLRSVF